MKPYVVRLAYCAAGWVEQRILSMPEGSMNGLGDLSTQGLENSFPALKNKMRKGNCSR